MKKLRKDIYTTGVAIVILCLMALNSCSDEDQNADQLGRLKSISIYLSSTQHYTLNFSYETPFRTNIDITQTNDNWVGKFKLILEYDDSLRIITEQFIHPEYNSNTTYIYQENMIIVKYLTTYTSYPDTSLFTDTLTPDEPGRVVKSTGMNWTWDNYNLISTISDPVTRSYTRQSNTGTYVFHITYTPMSIAYQYDNHVNPFASLNLAPNSYLFGSWDDYVQPFSPSENNIIEINGTVETYWGDYFNEHVETTTFKTKYDITYDVFGYPKKIIIDRGGLYKDKPLPEVHFKYFHDIPSSRPI